MKGVREVHDHVICIVSRHDSPAGGGPQFDIVVLSTSRDCGWFSPRLHVCIMIVSALLLALCRLDLTITSCTARHSPFYII